MKRSLPTLAHEEFDLLVIGGGAFGAAAAWDASLRGLKVALVDRCDFGAGASADCFKMVHGGIRYLQHLDLRRMRSSCAERSAMLRIAPHLVSPLPIVMPTYGWGLKGKPLLTAGMTAYDLLTLDRNRRIGDKSRRIHSTRLLSRRRVLELFPGLDPRGLTGAAIFEDGQMYNAARLVLAFLKSAAGRGAQLANYAEAVRFLWSGDKVCGARIRDRLSGDEFDLRSRLVLNSSGGASEFLLQQDSRFGRWQRGPFSRDAYFMVEREPRHGFAIALPGESRDKDAVLSRSARHMFAVPWRNRTLIGVWHRVMSEHPDDLRIEEAELAAWCAEINAIYPMLALRLEDVRFAGFGLVPFGDPSSSAAQLGFGKESRFIDHRREHGVEGLFTLIGIRFTTARADAATALDLLLKQWPSAPARAPTATTALAGGDFETFASLLQSLGSAARNEISPPALEALARNYGTEAFGLLETARTQAQGLQTVEGTNTLHAQITHAVRNEMAQRLEDVVLRRTDLGSAGHPGRQALEIAASRMQELLGWSGERRGEELASLETSFLRHQARGVSPSRR